MGMETKFYLDLKLSDDIPAVVEDALAYMTGLTSKPDVLPEHTLFEGTGFNFMMKLGYSPAKSVYSPKDKYLCIHSEFKNYESEIERFLDWIFPHVIEWQKEFVGFFRYESYQMPTLIYNNTRLKADGFMLLDLNDTFHTEVELYNGGE